MKPSQPLSSRSTPGLFVAYTVTWMSGLFFLCISTSAWAVSPEDHAKHHPQAAASQPGQPQAGGMGSPSAPSPGGAGMAGGGMMSGMGDMMREMGGPKTPEFYPSLMEMPELTDDTRAQLEMRAHERMESGTALMNQALMDLTHATSGQNYPAMRDALTQVREGLGQFESGLTTRQAISAGESPQKIGMNWFKVNLGMDESLGAATDEGPFLGLSAFHFFSMLLLAGFSATMIWMYFRKMKRATEILAGLSKTSPQSEAGKAPDSQKPTSASMPAQSAHPLAAKEGKPATAATQYKGKLKLDRIFSETPTVKTFRFVGPDGGELPFTYQAGQFLTLAVTIDGKPVKRAYSISSHPCHTDALELTIKREEKGLVSRYLHDVVREGDLMDMEASYGHLTVGGLPEDQAVVLIGGGVGITPLMSVLRCMIECGLKNEIYLLYACKTLEEFIYRDELKELAKHHRNIRLLVAVDRLEGSYPGAFEGRLTQEKIAEFVPNLQKSRVHLCGPPPMMKAIRTALTALHVPEEQVKTEAFGPVTQPKKLDQAPEPGQDAAQKQDAAQDSSSGARVHFTGADKTFPISETQTVLELAESNGIEIQASCRVGTCGTCKVKLLSGEVSMEVQDALTPEDKAQGVILACQAKAKGPLEIEEPKS